MYFKTASGYLGATPAYFSRYPIVHSFYKARRIPYMKKELYNFLSDTGTKTVIIVPDFNRNKKMFYLSLFGLLNEKPLYYKGVYIYNVPKKVNKYSKLSFKLTKPFIKKYYFGIVYSGALKYVRNNGYNCSGISPYELEKNKYIPGYFGVLKNKNASGFKKYYTLYKIWVGPLGKHGAAFGVGIGGSYGALKLILKK